MQLDGFTLLAQLFNFLILVYLLKKFLYKPILAAMDRRAVDIKQQLHDVESREQEATVKIAEYQNKTEQMESDRQQWLTEIKQELIEERVAQLNGLRQDIDQKRREWQQQLAQEQERFLNSLRQQLNTGVCHISRQVLAEFADATLEDQLLTVFIGRLHELSADEQQLLVESCTSSGEITISSAFKFNEPQCMRMKNTLQDLVGKAIQIHVDTQPDLICGIEISTAEQQIAWNISDYLEQLEEQFTRRLNHDLVQVD